MIECTVCGDKNDDLAVTCTRCKAYLQTKIENLDLFSTMWGLLESPRRTFKRIVLSRRKNYVFLLSALLGMWILWTLFWGLNVGSRFDTSFTLLATGIVLGPPAGLLVVLIGSLLLRMFARFFGGKASLRNTFAVESYSSVPVLFTLVFVYPIKIAIFGSYLFDQNPSPMIINAGLYIALLGFDVVAVIWSIALVVRGMEVAAGLTRQKSVSATGALLLLVVAAGIGIGILGSLI